MPSIEINSSDRRHIDNIKSFIAEAALGLPAESRMVLAIELNRLFRPELDELRRRAASTSAKARGEGVPDGE